MSKEEDLKFLKDFAQISILKICKELGIDQANLYSGRTSAEKTKEVKDELVKRLTTLME